MTLIQQVLDRDNLRAAWNAVAANDGIPGVDNLSIQAWRRNWEERLVELARRVRSNRYRPGKLRKMRVPKKTPGQYRELRIPTVTDRILQRAANQVLMPLYEKTFLDCSYGYRPERSLKDAVGRIIELRDLGSHWVLNADIDAFFDRIDHELLLKFLQDDLPDSSLIPLIASWVESGKGSSSASRGIPMGSPVSPLLANIFLHRLDLQIQSQGLDEIRYADDFIVLTKRESGLQAAFPAIGRFLDDLNLAYEPQKTKLTSFDEGFIFLGVFFKDNLYEYHWEGKRIEVSGKEVPVLFSDYLPDY